MNRRKTAAAGIAVLLIAGLLGGCKEKVTVESLLKKTAEASEKQAAVEASWNMGMDISMALDFLEGMDLSTTMEADGTTQMETETKLSYTKAALNVSAMGQSQDLDMEMYTEMADATHMTTYIYLLDEWGKSTVELPEEEKSSFTVAEMLELSEYFTLQEEPVTVKEKECWQMDAKIPAEKLLPKVSQYTTMMQAGSEVDLSLFDGKDFNYTMFIDKETSLPVEITFAMTASASSGEEAESGGETSEESEAAETETPETEAQAAEEAVEAEEETDSLTEDLLNTDVTRYEMVMDFSYPESLNIAIPNEARAAEEIDPGFSSLEEDSETGSMNAGSQYENLSAPSILREFAETDPDAVLWNDNAVNVRMTKIYVEDNELYVDMDITNDNGSEIELYSDAVAVNHVMSDGSFFANVKGKTTDTCCMSIMDLDSLGINQVYSLQLSLQASDTAKYDTLFSTGVRNVTIEENEAEAMPRSGGSVVLDSEQLKVTAYPETEGTYSREIPLCVANKTDQMMSLSSGTVTSGGKEISAYFYGSVLPGCICYGSLSADKENLEAEAIEKLEDIHFQLTAQNLETFEELFSTDEIVIP